MKQVKSRMRGVLLNIFGLREAAKVYKPCWEGREQPTVFFMEGM